MKTITVFHEGAVIGEYDKWPTRWDMPDNSWIYQFSLGHGTWYFMSKGSSLRNREAAEVPAAYRTQILLLT